MCKGCEKTAHLESLINNRSAVVRCSSLSMDYSNHQDELEVVDNKLSAEYYQSSPLSPCEEEESVVVSRSILLENQSADHLQTSPPKEMPHVLAQSAESLCQRSCSIAKNKLAGQEEDATVSIARRCCTPPTFSSTPGDKPDQSPAMPTKTQSHSCYGQSSPESPPMTPRVSDRCGEGTNNNSLVCCCDQQHRHRHHHHAFPHFSQRQTVKGGDDFNANCYDRRPEEQMDGPPSSQHRPTENSLMTSGMAGEPTLCFHGESSGESDLASSVSDDGSIVVEDSDDQLVGELQGLTLSPTEDDQSSEQRSDGGDVGCHGGDCRQIARIRLRNSTSLETLPSFNEASDNDMTNTVLIFVYGTLKRGYCNHYNLETDGIKYFQDGVTIHPYVMYLDSANRSRPCLTDGSSCPISELFDHQLTLTVNDGRCSAQSSSVGSDRATKGPQLVCPLCCFRQRQQHLNLTSDAVRHRDPQLRDQPEPLFKQSSSAKSLQEMKDSQTREEQYDLSPRTTNYSKHWGLPVRGELYFLNSSLLAALDRFERVPNHYVRQTITVRGSIDQEYYNAEVYFNRTSSQRWCELLDGRFRLLRDYTMDHHRLYQPRGENHCGLYRHQKSIESNRTGTTV